MTDSTNVFSLTTEGELAIVTIDVQGDTQNTLKQEFSPQLHSILAKIKELANVKAVVMVSGKEDSFIAGADIAMLEHAETEADVEAIAQLGHDAFQAVATFPYPIVAAIHGPCLGGGYEFALACHARIASDDEVTVLGLPEVQLGVLPGGGGTQRLPRLVGIAAALDIMLTGKRVRAKKAVKIGMIDEAVPKSILIRVAKKHALKLAAQGDFSAQSSTSSGTWLRSLTSVSGIQKLALEENSYGRSLLFDQARKKTLAKTLGNYPAAEKIIDCVEAGIEKGFEHGLATEKKAFAQLAKSPQAKQLMGIFFATNELKKDSGIKAEVSIRDIKQVSVLGGGLMGAGIAYVTMDKAKLPVRIRDISDVGVAGALNYSWEILQQKVRRKSLSHAEAGQKYALLTGTKNYSGMTRSDLYIEAVFEDLTLKHKIIAEIEAQGNKDAIIATNTSSIPISKIASVASKPENVIGLHYFSPVDKMPLLEIIVTEQTAPEVVATCVAFGKQQGKTVIVVNDGPGFYTSRILAPYMNEAGYLLSEGVAIDWLDAALKEFGFPVGPMTLVDEVGIDVGAKIAPILSEAFGARMQPPAVFEKILADGRQGKKNSRGFYQYGGKEKNKNKEVDESVYRLIGVTPNSRMAKQEIAERCALLMINEAFYCLQENIINRPLDGDIGAIFGLGFPPFLGGPFRYADAIGLAQIKETLLKYQSQLGERFKPAEILDEMINSERSFYS